MKVGFLLLFPLASMLIFNLMAVSGVSAGSPLYGENLSSFSVGNNSMQCAVSPGASNVACYQGAGFGVNAALNALFFTLIITTILVSAVLAGLQVFGSGLSSESVHILTIGLSWTIIWIVISGGALTLLSTIPFGYLIYVLLTVLYALGVIGQISRGS